MSVCADCGRRMRPKGTRAVDAPGLALLHSRTQCSTCHTRVQRGIPLPGNDYECADCHEWVDTGYPSSGKASRGGLCAQCQRVRTRPTYRGECKVCGVVMVGSTATPGPGERRHNGRGLCTVCYFQVPGRAPRATTPVDSPDPVLTAAVARFARERAARAERKTRADKALAVDYARRLAVRRRAS